MPTENTSIGITVRFNSDIVIWNLNHSMLKYYGPAAIYTVILILMGISGNSLVIYIYHFHFKKTTANLYIKILAILDVACCVFGMSYELIDLCFPLLNGERFSCKIFRGLEQTFEFISGEILLCIAYDRYLRVCKPLVVSTMKKNKRIVIATFMLGIIASSPTYLLIGPAELYVNGIKTTGCSFDDTYKDSSFKYIYYISLNAITGVAFLTMITLYILIWTSLCRWQKSHIGEEFTKKRIYSRPRSVNKESLQAICLANMINENTLTVMGNARVCTENHSQFRNLDSAYKEPVALNVLRLLDTKIRICWKGNTPITSKLDKLKRKKLMKPVIILFSVTMIFVLSFLPYFILMLLHSTGKVDPNTLEITQRRVWELAYKSYFLSNALNPLIYATFDTKFRRTLHRILFVM